MHGWQNVGIQKRMILEAKKGLEEDDQDPQKAVQCPMCKQPETQMHYTICEHAMPTNMRKQEIVLLRKTLQKQQTYEGITNIWIQSLTPNNPHLNLVSTNTIEDMINQAFTNQQEIGWHNLLRGFISSDWRLAQKKHFKQIKSERTSEQWATKSIDALQTYTMNMWQYRNQYLHGHKEHKQILRKELQVKVRKLYQHGDRKYIPKRVKIFTLPLEKRLNRSLNSLDRWVSLATRHLRLHREEATKNTLDLWLHDSNTTTPERQEESEKVKKTTK